MGEASSAVTSPDVGITVRCTTYGPGAHRALDQAVRDAKHGDPLAPVTLIVSTNLSGTVARRALARRTPAARAANGDAGVGVGVAGLTVLTLDRLAELVAAPTLTAAGRRPTTNPVLAAAWRRELADQPLCFEPVRDHPATVTALTKAHRELRDLSASALDAIAGTGQLPADLVTLHRRVVRRLHERWYDVRDLRSAARELLALGKAPDNLGAVVVFLPQDLDRSGADLVGALALSVPVTVIAAMTGATEADNGVRQSLRRIGVPDVDAKPTASPAATRVLHASDSDDEVRCVVRELLAALQRIPAHRIAVLYGNAAPYARLVHEQCAAAGIEVNGPGVRPTSERVLARAFTDLLALREEGFSRPAVLGLLSAGTVRDADGRLVPSARWERISRSAGVVSGDDWQPRLEHYAGEHRAAAAREQENPDDVREWFVARSTREAEAAEALLRFVSDLRTRLAAAAHATDWRTLATWALDTFHALLGTENQHWRLPEEEARSAERIERLLTGLVGLGSIEPTADLDALRQVVELELADDLRRTGKFGTGVLVAPLSAAVGLDADLVFVVGLAEGICPTHGHDDALLPDDVREAADGELPALRELLDRQHRHLLAAFAAAPEVVASFPRGDLRRSSERIPSRWLLPTLRSLTGVDTLAATDWERHASVPGIVSSPSFAASLTSAVLPATAQEWRVRTMVGRRDSRELLRLIRDDSPLSRAVELSRARRSPAFTRFDGDLSAYAAYLPDFTDGDRVVSPTSLEAWVSCPHGYFVQRLLGVEPVEQPEELLEMTALERGSLLHEALDRFFGWVTDHGGPPVAGEEWTIEHRRALRAIGREVADEFEERGVTGHPTMWARDLVRVLDDLNRVLDEDEKVRRDQGRRQLCSELQFGKGNASEAVIVTLPDGRTVRFRGAADRVDEAGGGALVVTDYKSGSATSFAGLSETDPDKNGSKLQLPVYALAARQRLDRPNAPVRAEYWFIGPKDRGKHVELPLTPAVRARHAAVVGTIVDGIAAGVFPANAPEDTWNGRPRCHYCDPDGLGAKDRRDQWALKKFDPKLASYLGLVEPDAQLEDEGCSDE